MPTSVALVSAVDPYPTDVGKKIVLAGFLEYLTERVGANNVHYIMVGGTDRDGFPVTLRPVVKPTGSQAMTSVLTRSFTGRASLQESVLYCPAVKEAIQQTLRDINPDLEIYDTVRMAQHAPQSNAKVVCYLDDLFSERYQGMLRAHRDFPGVDLQAIGNFGTHVPKAVRPMAEWPPSQRMLMRFERRLVQRSEDRAAHRFETTLLINPQEAEVLRARAGVDAARIHSIPPLLGPRPVAQRSYRGTPEFVFLGELSLAHNEDGLRHFLTSIWPLVLAERPDARLCVIGRGARPGLRALAAKYSDSVGLEGYVPDLTAMLSRAVALINPLRFGSGLKLKVIEALNAGLPVISSSVGADGLETGADQGVLVGDTAEDFARLMLEASDQTRNTELSTAAAEHFERRYSRRAVFDCYDAVFGLG